MAARHGRGHDAPVTVTRPTDTSIAMTVARWWQAAIAVIVAASLVLQLALLVEGGADANSGQSGVSVSLGVRLWRLFSYFTIQSNLIVLAVAIVLVLNPLRDGPTWHVVQVDALVGITITGLVYAIILAPQVQLTGGALVATIGLHYVSPWAAVLAWLVFGPRPRMTWLTVLGAFVWPVLWLVYIFTQGAFTRWYPYPFLDVTRLGMADSLRNAVFVLLVGVVLASS